MALLAQNQATGFIHMTTMKSFRNNLQLKFKQLNDLSILIGRWITITWAEGFQLYVACVISYDISSKKHQVCYEEGNDYAIEELSLMNTTQWCHISLSKEEKYCNDSIVKKS